MLESVVFKLDKGDLTNRIANKMIRPTTIPQTLNALKIEQAIAREALTLAAAKLPVKCKFVERNI